MIPDRPLGMADLETSSKTVEMSMTLFDSRAVLSNSAKALNCLLYGSCMGSSRYFLKSLENMSEVIMYACAPVPHRQQALGIIPTRLAKKPSNADITIFMGIEASTRSSFDARTLEM